MDSIWLTVLLSNDRWLFIEYFWGFVESLCVFYTSMFMVPKRALLSTLATPVSFVQTRPPVLLQVFLHSGKLFSIPVCTDVVCLYFFLLQPPLCKLNFRTWTSSSQSAQCCSSRHIISHFPSLRFVSAFPESLAVFLCFIKCPYSTEMVIGVFKENLPLG